MLTDRALVGRVCLLAVLSLAVMTGTAQAAPYSSHSQMYACCTDSATKEAMFREAKASGAAYIRVDFELQGIAPDPTTSRRYWSGPDEIAALSRRYQLPALVVLLGVADSQTSCPDAPPAERRLCPPVDAVAWGALAGEVAARYADTIGHYEIWNEPDGNWAFRGSPEDYAHMLSASFDAIKARAPGVSVVLGGTMHSSPAGNAWLDRVFRTPGVAAATKFDIGNIHLRGNPDWMVADLWARRSFLAGWGRNVPLWVTEHGYPSDPMFQTVVQGADGELAQAQYLAATLPALALNGADQVFVTLRDGGGGEFDSEGILKGRGLPGGSFRRKRAWQTVLDATVAWPGVLARARQPAPAPFSAAALRASVSARRIGRTQATPPTRAWTRHPGGARYRVTLKGLLTAPGCGGRVRLTYSVPGMRPVTRDAPVSRTCRYAVSVDLRPGRRVKLPARMKVEQRFSGTPTMREGQAETLSLKLKPERRSGRTSPATSRVPSP